MAIYRHPNPPQFIGGAQPYAPAHHIVTPLVTATVTAIITVTVTLYDNTSNTNVTLNDPLAGTYIAASFTT